MWPRAGWRRRGIYMAHRLRRLPGTPESIAAGFACGAAISFTPFIGLHFVLAALIAWLIGGNVIASAIGTAVGNPWSFPFIWAWIFSLGRWVLGVADVGALPEDLTMAFIFERPWKVLFPMIVGGIPTALVAWVGFYWPVKRAVAAYQQARRRARVHAYRRARQNRGKAKAKASKLSEGS
jgi:uncharacterized protein (DUF2062 family)